MMIRSLRDARLHSDRVGIIVHRGREGEVMRRWWRPAAGPTLSRRPWPLAPSERATSADHPETRKLRAS